MNCPKCSSQLHWYNDFNYEDYGREGDGIVGNYSCPNAECDVQDVMIYIE